MSLNLPILCSRRIPRKGYLPPPQHFFQECADGQKCTEQIFTARRVLPLTQSTPIGITTNLKHITVPNEPVLLLQQASQALHTFTDLHIFEKKFGEGVKYPFLGNFHVAILKGDPNFGGAYFITFFVGLTIYEKNTKN